MPKAVPDATVFVSALARGGRGARKVLLAWNDKTFELITSEPMLQEIATSLSAESVTNSLASELIANLSIAATLVEPTESITACRDPDDNNILDAAAGQADCIVPADKDLCTLTPFRGIEIITVNRFLRRRGIRRAR